MTQLKPYLEQLIHRMLNEKDCNSEETLLEYLRDQSLLNSIKENPHIETIKTECNGEEMYGGLVYETSDFSNILSYIPYTKGCSDEFDHETLVNVLNDKGLRKIENLKRLNVYEDGLSQNKESVTVSYQANNYPSKDFLLLGVESCTTHVRDTFLLRFTEDGWVDYEYIILNYNDNDITEYVHNETTHIFSVDESFAIKDCLYEQGRDAWVNNQFNGIATDNDMYNVTFLGQYNLYDLFTELEFVVILVNEYICEVDPYECNSTSSHPYEAGSYVSPSVTVEENLDNDKSSFCECVKQCEGDYDYVQELTIPNKDGDGKRYKLIIYIEGDEEK